jgi:predicted unusual protein kinase regulating ubiquinone biosynthesis (AarF/ABC1/UbiB family)
MRVLRSVAWWDIVLPRIGFRGASLRTRPARMKKIAADFRALAARMGGVLIKVGQFLSARLDVLPREITTELAGLQDEVGAEDFQDIKAIIEAEFGMPLEAKFAEFDSSPAASASIGQVHRARLYPSGAETTPGSAVVVKVQRPHIHEIVDADLAAVKVAGKWLTRFASIRKHANVPALIEEFSRVLIEEMDYLNEGKNAERFAGIFAESSDVLVPKVFWSHTSLRVLTLEDVGAIKITDYAGIEAAGVERREVAMRLLATYLTQVFEEGFFHADPHPGNLFVLPSKDDSRKWRLVFVDFGMTGTLSPQVFSALRDAIIALGTRDVTRLVGTYGKLNLLLPDADLELIERASRAVFDAVWGKAAKEIFDMDKAEAARFVDEFGDLLYEMPFQVPQNLILLGRCIAILSGMALGLDPEFNLWSGIAPFARRLVEADGQSRFRVFLSEAADTARVATGLPRRLDSLVSRLEHGRLEVRVPELQKHIGRLEHGFRKLAASIIFASFLMCGTAFYIAGFSGISIAFAAASAGLLLWILFRR